MFAESRLRNARTELSFAEERYNNLVDKVYRYARQEDQIAANAAYKEVEKAKDKLREANYHYDEVFKSRAGKKWSMKAREYFY